MKKILSLVAVLGLALNSNAQYLLLTCGLNGGTNNVAAAATNSFNLLTNGPNTVLSTAYGHNPSFALTVTSTTATNDVVTASWDASLDNINWQTNAFTQQLTITAAQSTNTFTSILNTNNNGQLYFRLGTLGHTNNVNTLTNVIVKASFPTL